MRRIVVSDASCLIVLAKVDHLWLLQKNYDEVIVPPEVVNEFGEIGRMKNEATK